MDVKIKSFYIKKHQEKSPELAQDAESWTNFESIPPQICYDIIGGIKKVEAKKSKS